MKTNALVKVIASIAVITASALWTRQTLSTPNDPQIPVHRSLGRTLATECSAVLQGQGKLMVIALEPGSSAAMDWQLDALRSTLKVSAPGIDVQVVEVDDKGESKYGPGFGLSSNRLQRILRKNPGADAVVSLLGLPAIDVDGAGSVDISRQKWIAYSRTLKKLKPGEGGKTPDVVVVPRFQFPAPVVGVPRTDAEWFDMSFQTLRAGQPL